MNDFDFWVPLSLAFTVFTVEKFLPSFEIEIFFICLVYFDSFFRSFFLLLHHFLFFLHFYSYCHLFCLLWMRLEQRNKSETEYKDYEGMDRRREKSDRFMKRDEEPKKGERRESVSAQCLSSDDLLFSHDSAPSDSKYTLFYGLELVSYTLEKRKKSDWVKEGNEVGEKYGKDLDLLTFTFVSSTQISTVQRIDTLGYIIRCLVSLVHEYKVAVTSSLFVFLRSSTFQPLPFLVSVSPSLSVRWRNERKKNLKRVNEDEATSQFEMRLAKEELKKERQEGGNKWRVIWTVLLLLQQKFAAAASVLDGSAVNNGNGSFPSFPPLPSSNNSVLFVPFKSWMINVKKCAHLIKQHPWNQPKLLSHFLSLFHSIQFLLLISHSPSLQHLPFLPLSHYFFH